MLELPRSSGDGPLRLFLNSLKKLVESLQKHFNRKVTESDLKSSIKKYNRRRVLLHNLYDLRKKHPPKIAGWEVLNVINTAMTAPINPFCQNLTLLIQELNLNSRLSHLSESLPRVLVSGNIIDNPEMIKTIEESGCVVVADDLCSGTRFFWNLVDEDGDPLEALARSYLQKPPCMRTSDFERRMASIKELVEEFRVDAVIYLSIKFCDNALFEFPMIRQFLTRMGIPVLFLESEYTSVPKGQVRTRVGAFLETL
jgi:benzoyl-CoA reductase/2-hydroxyglutaryl-CoA dehydratase subunit BcrC/BadD/HgdB